MFYYWLVYYKETDIPLNSGQPAPDFISQDSHLTAKKTISISESSAFALHADI